LFIPLIFKKMQETQKPGESESSDTQKKGTPDMHSSKDAQESQGGKGGHSNDTDTNSEHDQGNEHSIAGREDS
jgi:hypothetical protein